MYAIKKEKKKEANEVDVGRWRRKEKIEKREERRDNRKGQARRDEKREERSGGRETIIGLRGLFIYLFIFI